MIVVVVVILSVLVVVAGVVPTSTPNEGGKADEERRRQRSRCATTGEWGNRELDFSVAYNPKNVISAVTTPINPSPAINPDATAIAKIAAFFGAIRRQATKPIEPMNIATE